MENKNQVSIQILSKWYSFVAVIVWILNDLYFKSIFHNDLTGKISDIIGLFYTPILLTAFIILFCNYKDYRIKESKILFITMVLVGITFVFLNLNQKTNDLLTKYVWFFIPSKGIADRTDLYCLLVYIPLGFVFNHFQNRRSEKQFKVLKYLTPIFVSFAMINTSSTDNSDNDMSRLFLFTILADTNDKIVVLTPQDGETFQKSQTINFNWSYKNYYGITEPSFYDQENGCGVTQQLFELKNYTTGKFQNYVVQIANNEAFSPITAEINSNGMEKKAAGQINNSGTYYYKIALQYKNKDGCSNANFLIFLPQPVKKILILD
ncbi:hypothetical protein EHQ16_13120 [Leptospira kanakyensis]|uniref:Uncharacterized protein n=1 Tax=Leptospira kanakyensis TaxID=2484968 RepID=A0A6N4PWN7_9LEPT|nr:hypothetical protein [Leptospira kanakyensis]TGK49957.1 hypothetical protein EHQ11_09500 [Leptospira kanakyensis]TGK58526.1 hypothetical protein EHQ16_13120 [Leptospira kanakyensis]TGK69095.1 hypothetical protein EHQ18_09660 [Leptospira kanakyensis]